MSINEFEVMHTWMKAYVERCDREGWASPEVQEYANRVMRGLWACANNPPNGVINEILAEDTEKLAQAQAKAKPPA